ncbi:MAG: hypothetical protein HFJ10_10720 [Lachnospiraceae bacterium]|nr:hypothetical protein [Lachnospiraceae bacterium]
MADFTFHIENRRVIALEKQENEKNKTIIEGYDYLGNSCSTTDCTGLIPSSPQSEAEYDSYEEVYHFQPKVTAKTDTSRS